MCSLSSSDVMTPSYGASKFGWANFLFADMLINLFAHLKMSLALHQATKMCPALMMTVNHPLSIMGIEIGQKNPQET